MTKGRLRVGIALLAVGLVLPALTFAGEPAEPSSDAAAQPASDRIASANVVVVEGSLDQAPALGTGMVVAIDPATGERRAPTAGEVADLSAAARYGERRPDDAELHQFAAKGGGTGLLLDHRHLISETVTLRLDGTLSQSHRLGAAESLDALLPALPPAATATAAEPAAPAADEEVTP